MVRYFLSIAAWGNITNKPWKSQENAIKFVDISFIEYNIKLRRTIKLKHNPLYQIVLEDSEESEELLSIKNKNFSKIKQQKDEERINKANPPTKSPLQKSNPWRIIKEKENLMTKTQNKKTKNFDDRMDLTSDHQPPKKKTTKRKKITKRRKPPKER